MRTGSTYIRMMLTWFSALAALSLVGANAFGAAPQQGPPQQDAAPLPFVSPIFGDNMVLQRDKPNTMWGWSQPGDSVRVEIGAMSATGTAGAGGRWQVKIQPPPVGGPYTVKISGRQTVELHEVLVGDVWICSGQSNMQFGLGQARNGADEVKNANYPQIRYFVVGERVSYSPVESLRGTWRVVSPATVGGRGGGISAAAYFFARRVQESLHVPIGLIQEAVGGVPAETFVSPDGFRPLHNDGGLVVKGDKLGEFQIAGADRKWYWADARIEGATVLVSSHSVPKPVAVRYAWQSNPLATLFNGAGLPAEPFRTDDWPAMTASHEPYGNDPLNQGMQ